MKTKMRSGIDTLEQTNKITKEERKFIEDYFRYVRVKMNKPTHPEIVIGMVRYPIGRFNLRTTLAKKFIEIRKLYLKKKEETTATKRFLDYLDNMEKVIMLSLEVREKGKTVKKHKRK